MSDRVGDMTLHLRGGGKCGPYRVIWAVYGSLRFLWGTGNTLLAEFTADGTQYTFRNADIMYFTWEDAA